MVKKINWESIYTPPGSKRGAAGKPKYTSIREKFAKAKEEEVEYQKIHETLQKARPVLETLLKCRLEDRSELTVLRPMTYTSSDLRETSGGAQYIDVQKSIAPGTKLKLKSLDPNLHEFIFENQLGEEVVLPYSAKQSLLTQTNIYEDAMSFIESNQGE